MAVTIFKGSDGKEYFNLTAQSGGVTTANDPEDFWAAEGTINFPYKFYNTGTQKEESYLGDAIISSSSDDIVDVAIDGLDEDNKPIATTIKLNGTTEVKLLKKFWRINSVKARELPFVGNIKVYNSEKGVGTMYAIGEAGHRESRMGLYSPSKTLFIQKIELISGIENSLNTVVINKYIPSEMRGETIANALLGTRVPIKYIQFEKPAGVVQPCDCYEFKNPHRISVGESIFITIEEVTDSNAFRCNIEGYFQ